MKSWACLFAMLALACASWPASAGSDLRKQLQDKLEARLKQINDDFDGVLGVQLIDLTDGNVIGLNANEVFPTASTIKVAILVELYRQAEHSPGLLTRQHPFEPTPKTANTGMARLLGPGSSVAVQDLARMMINLSENTATNLIIDMVGMESVNHLTESLGLGTIKLRRKMLESDAQVASQENVASPADAAKLMLRIARCDLPMSKSSCAAVRAILEIPQSPHPAKDFIPAEIPVAFKPGFIEGVSSAWAIVDLPDRPYVFAIMSTYGTDGPDYVGKASHAAYDYFWRLARANDYGLRASIEAVRKAHPKIVTGTAGSVAK
jgi:beta-lactamase class A